MSRSADLAVFSSPSPVAGEARAATRLAARTLRDQSRDARDVTGRVARGAARVLRGGSGGKPVDLSLRETIGVKLGKGHLPKRLAVVHLGRGPSAACSGCDAPLATGQSFVWGDDDAGARHRFHVACFSMWDRLCQQQPSEVAMADPFRVQDTETTDLTCPACGGSAVTPLGRVEAVGESIRSRYCCLPCRLGFWYWQQLTS